MGKKKKFIDKKKSATFQILARDSSDPNYSEGPSGDRVFVRVDGNTSYSNNAFFDGGGELNENGGDDANGIFEDAPDDYSDEDDYRRDRSSEKQTEGSRGGSSLPDHVRREILELGFPDDGYNYLIHLREIRNTGAGSSYYQNPKAKLDQLPRDVKAYDATKIEVSKADDDSYEKSIYGVAAKTVAVRVQKAIDPEVAALLDDSDDSRFASDVEGLEEDFVFTANLPEESEPAELYEKLSLLLEDSKENKKEIESSTSCSQDNLVDNFGSGKVISGVDDGGVTVVDEKPRVRRPLDEQFDMLELQEYGTDSEDGYDGAISEENEFHDSLAEMVNHGFKDIATDGLEMDGYKVLLPGKMIEEEPVSLETAADLIPRCREYAEKYENENDDEDVVILEESSDESEIWDCETIVSTYSNLDNHPGKIEAPGARRKKKLAETISSAFSAPSHVISLKGKEKLPVDYLPQGRLSAMEKVKDRSNLKNQQQPQKKLGVETKEEKKLRKAAVKEERREARRTKKGLKELYKTESQQAQKVAAFTGPSSIHLM